MAKTKKPQSTFVTLSLDKIKPYNRNPREISPEAVDDLARIIKNVGYVTRIIVDEKNVILVGHTRLRALYQLDYDEAEVHRYTGLSTAQKQAFRIADNRLGENTDWNYDTLAEELRLIDSAGDLFQELFTGFDPSQVASILEPLDFNNDKNSVSTTFGKSFECPECHHKWTDGD